MITSLSCGGLIAAEVEPRGYPRIWEAEIVCGTMLKSDILEEFFLWTRIPGRGCGYLMRLERPATHKGGVEPRLLVTGVMPYKLVRSKTKPNRVIWRGP